MKTLSKELISAPVAQSQQTQQGVMYETRSDDEGCVYNKTHDTSKILLYIPRRLFENKELFGVILIIEVGILTLYCRLREGIV